MADPSGSDELTWPEVADALERERDYSELARIVVPPSGGVRVPPDGGTTLIGTNQIGLL